MKIANLNKMHGIDTFVTFEGIKSMVYVFIIALEKLKKKFDQLSAPSVEKIERPF
jgi:hypothetical protein